MIADISWQIFEKEKEINRNSLKKNQKQSDKKFSNKKIKNKKKQPNWEQVRKWTPQI